MRGVDSLNYPHCLIDFLVLPTCVGLIPVQGMTTKTNTRSPHVRGVDSNFEIKMLCCFLVLPTCVGLILKKRTKERTTDGSPHVRGGVSGSSWWVQWLSSPHVRGVDSSSTGQGILLTKKFSPRAWG